MAINKIDQPGAATPTGNDDYTQQNLLINGNISITNLVLTDWASIISTPAIKEGTYFVHSGNLYQTQTADENISGTISNGLNYIAMSVSGTTLVPSYITSLSGYAWNPAYGGMYNGTTLAIPAVVFLSGTNYYRGLSLDKSLSGNIVYAYGGVTFNNSVSVAGNLNITGNLKLIGAATDEFKINGPAKTYNDISAPRIHANTTNEDAIYDTFATYMEDGKYYLMAGLLTFSISSYFYSISVSHAMHSGSTITFYGATIYTDSLSNITTKTVTDGIGAAIGATLILGPQVGA